MSRKRKMENKIGNKIDDQEDVSLQPIAALNIPIRTRRRAISRISREAKAPITAIEPLNLSKTQEKTSSLNKCFIEAVGRALEKKSDYDLTPLFDQYKRHCGSISNRMEADFSSIFLDKPKGEKTKGEDIFNKIFKDKKENSELTSYIFKKEQESGHEEKKSGNEIFERLFKK